MNGQYFSPLVVFGVLLAYAGLLLFIGYWAERSARRGREVTRRGWVYALSLTVYCTSWTFFGSVGSAANSGMLYSAIYLGPTLVMLVAWGVVRRMIRLRERYRFSSVVDLITQRYGQSLAMGAFITLVLLLGILPYIGLQIRAILGTFSLITGLEHKASTVWFGHFADEAMVLLIGLLTGIFGLRRVDTRVRQHGMIAVLAAESVVKLVAFVAVGLFVTYGLFDGLADIQQRVESDLPLWSKFSGSAQTGSAYLTWMSYLVLSMAAVLFLPRMFHVMVIENHDERHLATAIWLFPLYLLVISFFVLPIALGGLVLGYPANGADWFVIRLPFDHGSDALTLLAYLGGFSAAVGMVMVAGTAMSIMFSNHIVLPLIDRGRLGNVLKGRLRSIRWAVVFVLLAVAYEFQDGLRNSYLLIQMGLISFAAMLQFGPAALGALYWSRASKIGAWWGLGLGWVVWFYTLFVPAAVRSGLGDVSWLAYGPWGVTWLRPEALFGLDVGSPMFTACFWSMLFNLAGFVLGSLLRPPAADELPMIDDYRGILRDLQEVESVHGGDARIDFLRVRRQINQLFGRYLPAVEAEAACALLFDEATLMEGQTINGASYLKMSDHAERMLAGTVGAAMARKAVTETLTLSDQEMAGLQQTWTHQLAQLKITPQQLREQVDYFRSLNSLATTHAAEMENKVRALEDAAQGREKADAALRESEARFRSLADSAPVMIWLSGSSDGNDFFNRAWCTFTGRSSAEESGQGWRDGIHKDDWSEALGTMLIAIEQQSAQELVFRLRRHDGVYRQMRVNVLPRYAEDGTFLGIVGSAVDVSDLMAAEEALRRNNDDLERLVSERTVEMMRSLEHLRDSEETIRAITASAQDAVIMLNAAGQVSFWNPAGERLFGWTSEEVMGQLLEAFLIPERLRERHRVAYARFQKGQRGSGGAMGRVVEMVALHRSGAEIPVELALSATTLHGEVHAIGMLRDIAERQKATLALNKAKAWSDDIIRFAPTLVIGLDPAGRIVLFNEYAEQLTGYRRDEVLGEEWVARLVPTDEQADIRAILEEAVETGDVLHANQSPILLKDGSQRWISWNSQAMQEDGKLKMVLSFGVDMTERRRAEKALKKSYADLKQLNQQLESAQNQLLQSEKMASIGQLAAGVAHEINNPVGFVNSNLGTLRKYTEQMLALINAYQSGEAQISDPALLSTIGELKAALDIEFLQEDLPDLLKESEDGLLRVKKIVQDLKDFSHVNESEWQYADLNAGLDSTLNVVWNEVKYKASVVKEYGAIPHVECLAAQLNQVFMNMIVNAVQSLDESKGMGTLTLSTGQAGDEVWVQVRDSGKGMSPEVKKRIFEPFYTTKPVGKGTGLGLSLSFSIVQKHGGRIECESIPGQGTAFRVWVPIKRASKDAT